MITFFYFLSVLGLSEGSVTFIQDPRVDILVEKHIETGRFVPINGFRINIFSQSGNHSRGGAMAAQSAFSTRFPDMNSYVSFEEPYFRVNVGNFRTQLEAAAAIERLIVAYPQAFLVRNILNIKDLLGITEEDLVSDEEEEDDVF